ncbi:ankyrin repeat domain-containing protein [Candidatus Comchoanobacter bicostacola]|uniref:Ankyrin repeat domain-containing protein n=1 Tax=Candidatus Comchoanobacter bicostacola TaxID=2919598 RepID=A0ABY5DLB2_9GAMM|nr:ankyrin repeat domain-containing protein [Candidatus Comchoanobacter bicostacola]UTC24454.1 ankyrin repeat domain-containing protein [Candidatus Comchoanobacter bicostacola]
MPVDESLNRLWGAIVGGEEDSEVLEKLKEVGSDDISAAKEEGKGLNLLHLAAIKGYDSSVIDALKDAGVDINATDSSGLTPLHQASYNGNFKSVQALIAKGADIASSENVQRDTPLHAVAKAAAKGNESELGDLKAIANLLVKYGANKDVKNGGDKTADDILQDAGITDFFGPIYAEPISGAGGSMTTRSAMAQTEASAQSVGGRVPNPLYEPYEPGAEDRMTTNSPWETYKTGASTSSKNKRRWKDAMALVPEPILVGALEGLNPNREKPLTRALLKQVKNIANKWNTSPPFVKRNCNSSVELYAAVNKLIKASKNPIKVTLTKNKENQVDHLEKAIAAVENSNINISEQDKDTLYPIPMEVDISVVHDGHKHQGLKAMKALLERLQNVQIDSTQVHAGGGPASDAPETRDGGVEPSPMPTYENVKTFIPVCKDGGSARDALQVVQNAAQDRQRTRSHSTPERVNANDDNLVRLQAGSNP